MEATLHPVIEDLSQTVPTLISLTPADLTDLGEELADYVAHFAPLFARREQRAWAGVYLRGLLLSEVPRKRRKSMRCEATRIGDRATKPDDARS